VQITRRFCRRRHLRELVEAVIIFRKLVVGRKKNLRDPDLVGDKQAVLHETFA